MTTTTTAPTSTSSLPRLLTTAQVAEMLQVRPRTVCDMAAGARFPAPVVDEPRVKRWNPRHVQKFLDTGRIR